MSISRRELLGSVAALAFATSNIASAETQLDAAEARAIAREAYIYAYPMVDSYRIMYAYHIDRSNPEFKAPWNEIKNTSRVFTPEDKAVQTPNSDTPYSMVGADLRAEPIVLTIPPMEKERYFSVQLIDAYTFNFDYLGTRTTGNGGGNFLIAGPRWQGDTPPGITKVLNSETEFALCVYRTQLFNPDDLDNVKKVQAGYKVQPLSAFLGRKVPAAAPAIDFPKPLTPAEQKTSLQIFGLLNFILQFCPTVPSEADLMSRFARIGIGAGRDFDASRLSPELKQAFESGIADAWAEFDALKKRIDAGEITSGDMFGTRAFLKNNYLYRMAAAIIGIYGNSREEAVYPFYGADSEGRPLDGHDRYTIRFAPGALPPANAFWSLTMYKMPESLLYANPINRYLINSAMLPNLRLDEDGGLTLLIQNDSPGPDGEANWLPAPQGPFFMALRIYWPKPEALDGTWKAPKAERHF